jgi:hypothetical protein
VLGMSRIVTRVVDGATQQVTYVFRGIEPLNLGDMASLLTAERDCCYAAFEAFQSLVAEHEAVIAATP